MLASPAVRGARPGDRPPRHARHVPALDGLRALALLGVLAFHAGGALPGGYLGVDLFFVLSGFLITSLLIVEERATGRIALTAFWVRRAKRLFPALLALVPAIAVYGRLLAKPQELAPLRADILSTLAYVANWHSIVVHRSYWQLFAAPSPLEHTWSLAIEEQFYVLWPLIAIAVLPRGLRALRLVTAVLMVASMAAMIALYRTGDPSRAYLGTDTRAAGILAGALLATCLPSAMTRGLAASRRTVRALDAAGALAALGLAWAWCALKGEDPLLYRGGLWVTELFALVLVVCAVAGPASLVARALAWRPLTLLGTLSYGVYLWHWPIDVVVTSERAHLHGLALQALRLALTLAVAWVSYRFIERPIRRGGLPFGRPVYVVPAAIVLAVVLAIHATDASARPSLDEPPAVVPGGSPFHLVMLGDSTANSLGWSLRALRRPGLQVDLSGVDGCTLLQDTCNSPGWADTARAPRPDAVVVFLGGAFLHGIGVDGRWRKSCHPAWDRRFEEVLAARLAELDPSRGNVWLATVPPPLASWDTEAIRGEVACINVSLARVAAAVPGVRLLDVGEHLCPGGACVRERDGVTLRPDGVHFAIDGAADVAAWVLDRVR